MIRRDPHRSRPRFGFTLIELLVVIVIIGILIGLLLPVIVAAIRKANEAKASAEIQTLALGLAKFKDTYGEFPPSRVILSESGVYSLQGTFPTPVGNDFTTPLSAVTTWYGMTAPTNFGTPDISFGELAQRSVNFLRKMYPRASLRALDLDNSNTFDANFDYWPDYNGNTIRLPDNSIINNSPDPGFIYLEGHECLAFFLGGIPIPTAGTNGAPTFGTSGFGKEPVYPFKNNNGVSITMSTANRTPPSYEFRAERLIDPDGDGIPGYLDSYATSGVGQFFAYFAAYGNTGYDPNDMNSIEADSISNPVGSIFRIGLPTVATASLPQPTPPPPALPPQTVFSPAPNPYTTGLPTPVNAGAFNLNQSASYVNVNSFQIISAGGDGLFGPGGQWTSSGDRLPIPPTPPYPDQTSARPTEADNLSNFTTGRLN